LTHSVPQVNVQVGLAGANVKYNDPSVAKKGTTLRKAFEADFAKDVAAALQIDQTRVTITSIMLVAPCGSSVSVLSAHRRRLVRIMG
jgi:hypothetical protein